MRGNTRPIRIGMTDNVRRYHVGDVNDMVRRASVGVWGTSCVSNEWGMSFAFVPSMREYPIREGSHEPINNKK